MELAIYRLIYTLLVAVLIVLIVKAWIIPRVMLALKGKRLKKTENKPGDLWRQHDEHDLEEWRKRGQARAREKRIAGYEKRATRSSYVDELFEEVGSLTPEDFETDPEPLVPVAYMSHWRLATAAEILALPPEALKQGPGVIMDGEYRIEVKSEVGKSEVIVHKLIKRVPLSSGDGGPGFVPVSGLREQPSPLTLKVETGVFISVQDRETIDRAVEFFGDMADPYPESRGAIIHYKTVEQRRIAALEETRERLREWYREWIGTDAIRLLSTSESKPERGQGPD